MTDQYSEQIRENGLEIGRLREQVDAHYKELHKARENRQEMIRQYVGRHYSNNASKEKQPVNFIELAINVYTNQLVANRPEVLVTTTYQELEPQTELLRLATNHLMKEIVFEDLMQQMVYDAFFMMGIAKKGLCMGRWQHVADQNIDVGQPFAETISFDDWVHDTSVSKYNKIALAGDKYRIPKELLSDSNYFDPEAVKQLDTVENKSLNPDGSERASSISVEGFMDSEGFDPVVEVWDMWLPRKGIVVTFPVTGGVNDQSEMRERPLRVVKWQGPERGPYDILSFNPVPDNILPLPPTALWRDLSELGNGLFRKMEAQAKRQKTILTYQRGGEKDAKSILTSGDGEAIGVDVPQSQQEINFGGVDQISLAFWLQVRDIFSWFAGNLDSIGGLSPQAETLGQDQMLAQNASKRIAGMQEKVTGVATRILRDLMWYLYYDPFIELPLARRIPGFEDLYVTELFSRSQLRGEFLDFNFDIVPYSMQYRTPSMRVQSVLQFLERVVIPLLPMLQEQGIFVKMETLLKTISEYENLPELNGILEFTGQVQAPSDGGPHGDPPRKSPFSVRKYERISRSGGGTRSGRDFSLSQSLLNSKMTEQK